MKSGMSSHSSSSSKSAIAARCTGAADRKTVLILERTGQFSVTAHRDEDDVWVVECPAIPGCVSQGQTHREALDNIKDAIALCLEVRAEQGL